MSSVKHQKVAKDSIIVISNESSVEIMKDDRQPEQRDSPRIIGNELLVKPQTFFAADNMDELSSLEREIAKMHHVEDTPDHMHTSLNVESVLAAYNITKNDFCSSDVSQAVNNELCSMELKTQITNGNDQNPIASGETSLEHEDLIAVLKGLDDIHNSGIDSELIDGVTIEGEGEYQIMEVIDDDSMQFSETPTSLTPMRPENSPTKKFGAAIITTDEQRALALEQMEGLKTKSRRRKQDIKPIKQADSIMDLVSALEAEWTDTDDDAKELISHSNTKVTTVKIEPSKVLGEKTPLVTSVVVIPSSRKNYPEESSRTVSATTISCSDMKEMVSEKSPPVGGIIETKTEEDSELVATNTGFRRTRVIKRKIIWDPDAPETTLSYAKLVASSKPKMKQEPNSTYMKPLKKETMTNVQKKIQKAASARDKKVTSDTLLSLEYKSSLNKKTISNDVDNKSPTNSNNRPLSPVRAESPSYKKRSQTPVPGCAKKRKITELDRLMGDEGAINMLNSLEKLECSLGVNDNKLTRPMMRSRAATISEKAAIRKDSRSPVRTPHTESEQSTNKGKRTVKSRASSNWDYVYKQKQKNLDDAMIIRRRSNSSYSSTTSANRLSIDGPSTTNNAANNGSTKISDTTNSLLSPDSSKVPEDITILSNRKGAGAEFGSKIATFSSSSGKSFEFAKPENKKTQRRTKTSTGTFANDLKKPANAANKRIVRNGGSLDENKSENSYNKSPLHTNNTIKEKIQTSDFMVKKFSKVAQIIFSSNRAKISYTFTTEVSESI